MSKTKHPANMMLLTESEHFVPMSALLFYFVLKIVNDPTASLMHFKAMIPITDFTTATFDRFRRLNRYR